jgi:hypothetical protein
MVPANFWRNGPRRGSSGMMARRDRQKAMPTERASELTMTLAAGCAAAVWSFTTAAGPDSRQAAGSTRSGSLRSLRKV